MPTLPQLARGTQNVLPTAFTKYRNGENVVESMRITRFIGTKMALVNSTVRSSNGRDVYGVATAFYGGDPNKPKPDDRCGVRCSCEAYYFWFSYANRGAGAAHGARFKPYERKTPPSDPRFPPKNPANIPGLCKHLLLVQSALSNSDFFKATVTS